MAWRNFTLYLIIFFVILLIKKCNNYTILNMHVNFIVDIYFRIEEIHFSKYLIIIFIFIYVKSHTFLTFGETWTPELTSKEDGIYQ